MKSEETRLFDLRIGEARERFYRDFGVSPDTLYLGQIEWTLLRRVVFEHIRTSSTPEDSTFLYQGMTPVRVYLTNHFDVSKRKRF